MARVVTSTIASRLEDIKLWVKVDFQQHSVLAENFAVGGALKWLGTGAEFRGDRQKLFDWTKIELKFTPIPAQQFIRFDIPAHGNDVVYLTIITEGGEILCNACPKKIDRNIVIMEDKRIRNGVRDRKRPWAIDDVN